MTLPEYDIVVVENCVGEYLIWVRLRIQGHATVVSFQSQALNSNGHSNCI